MDSRTGWIEANMGGPFRDGQPEYYVPFPV
jgi:hypothetical protein